MHSGRSVPDLRGCKAARLPTKNRRDTLQGRRSRTKKPSLSAGTACAKRHAESKVGSPAKDAAEDSSEIGAEWRQNCEKVKRHRNASRKSDWEKRRVCGQFNPDGRRRCGGAGAAPDGDPRGGNRGVPLWYPFFQREPGGGRCADLRCGGAGQL